MKNHSPNMPTWAKNIDEKGVRRWHKEKSLTARRGEYVWAIIWNFIFLWIINKLPDWNLSFITESFGAVVWVITMNIYVQIGGNLLMLLFDHRTIRYLSRAIIEAASLVTVLTLYFIFPFDFTNFYGLHWLNWLLPILFIVSMVVSALKVISNIWKLIFWSAEKV